jgi:hypothetical protein
MNDCHKMVDQLVAHFTTDEYRDEVLSAKKEFFEQAGIVDEEDHHFESRMAQFLDWFIFTRPLTKVPMLFTKT